MEDTIILYTSGEHLNSFLPFAQFITKHHPSIPIIIISTAPDSAASSVSSIPSITYHHLAALPLQPNVASNPIELLFEVPRINNPKLHQALVEISGKCNIRTFVIDFFCNPAFEVSTSLDIPTYFFFPPGGFGACSFLYFPTIDEMIPQDIGTFNDFLEIPGCPPIHSSDFPKAMFFRQSNTYKHFLDAAKNMRRSAGIVINTFEAIEFRAKEALNNGLCVPNGPSPPAFFIGPLVAGKTGDYSGERHECLKWLDSQPSKSVIFLCFGRRGMFSAKQLREIAVGLENSGHRFLLSVRNPPEKPNVAPNEDPDLDELLPEGFLTRTKSRGFIIKSWAPQAEILSHNSVSGFVTHCGMLSILEAMSAGVPMIGWPLYADQRMIRVCMVEESKVALTLDETAEGFVTAAELEKRITELMGSSKGRAIRERVAEMKVSAEAAVSKGGSSVVALEKFVSFGAS